MKFLPALSLLTLLFINCADSDKEQTKEETTQQKEESIKKFGFDFADYKVIKSKIKSGDTFGTLIQNYYWPDSLNVYQITQKVKDSFKLRNIKIGKEYYLFLNKENPKNIDAFVYVNDRLSYTIVHAKDSIYVENFKKPISIKRRVVSTKIIGSIAATLQREKIGASVAPKLANIYKYSIDFFKIQKNDKIKLILHEKYIDDSINIGVERIEAAYIKHKGQDYFAFPYKLNKNDKLAAYYDENGRGLRSMFLKAPLDYFRISSRFTKKRFHPVQKRWKAHSGTDYAAPHGTPIKSTAAGVVIKRGYTSGNGNYVKIKHNSTYTTQYLHMSKILVRQGQRVAQGQTIGKVGSTGLATGPHVCYRFWKNGVQVDPYKQNLPNAVAMNKAQKNIYLQHISPLLKELAK